MRLELSDCEAANLRAALQAMCAPDVPASPARALHSGDWTGQILARLPAVAYKPNASAVELAARARAWGGDPVRILAQGAETWRASYEAADKALIEARAGAKAQKDRYEQALSARDRAAREAVREREEYRAEIEALRKAPRRKVRDHAVVEAACESVERAERERDEARAETEQAQEHLGRSLVREARYREALEGIRVAQSLVTARAVARGVLGVIVEQRDA